jgi:hypothetical protein
MSRRRKRLKRKTVEIHGQRVEVKICPPHRAWAPPPNVIRDRVADPNCRKYRPKRRKKPLTVS